MGSAVPEIFVILTMSPMVFLSLYFDLVGFTVTDYSPLRHGVRRVSEDF
jgi:hypothetical protein